MIFDLGDCLTFLINLLLVIRIMLKLSVTNDSMFQQDRKNEFLSQMTSLFKIRSEYIGIINKKED